MPAFWLCVSAVMTPISSGPMKDVTFPVSANSPKYCAIRSFGAIRISRVRDAACSGPPAALADRSFQAPGTEYRWRAGADRKQRAAGRSLAGVNGYVLKTMTPETATTCHYFWAFVRNHRLTEQRLTTEIRDGVAGIFHEDEIILEAQQRAIDANPDRAFYNLNSDAGAMWARRMIDRMIDRESPPSARQAAE